MYVLKISLSVYSLSSHCLWIVFHRAGFKFQVQLINYFFCGLCLCCSMKKSSPYPRPIRGSTMLSSSFTVLCFTFKCVIHFELLFVKGVKSVSRFIFLHVHVQLFLHHLLKRLSLLHGIAFVTLSKMSLSYHLAPLIYLSVLLQYSTVLFTEVLQQLLTGIVLQLGSCPSIMNQLFWTFYLFM